MNTKIKIKNTILIFEEIKSIKARDIIDSRYDPESRKNQPFEKYTIEGYAVCDTLYSGSIDITYDSKDIRDRDFKMLEKLLEAQDLESFYNSKFNN